MNMFKIIFSGLVMAIFISCGNADKNVATSETDSTAVASSTTDGIGRMEFDESVYEFGQVKEGEIVEHVFEFKNTGTAPIILSQVSASCGCTTPSYTQTPVLPGKTGEIKVKFDSNNQVGKQQKIISIASNADNGIMTVQLKGEVLPK